MPSAQELKKVRDFLDVQITMVEREEREAEQAHLQAKEEARLHTSSSAWAATKKAQREEEEQVQEQARLVAEARAWEEEQHAYKEEARC